MNNLFDKSGYLRTKIQQRIAKEFSLSLIEELLSMTTNRVEVMALQGYLYWEINDRVLDRLLDLKDNEKKL